MLPRSRGVPPENPPQTDLRVVFFFWGCRPLPLLVGGISQRHSTLAPFHCKSMQTLGLSHGAIVRLVRQMRPPALPCIPPMPSQILITTPARLTTRWPLINVLLCYHSGTAPLHRFTAKACKPSGYLMAPLSGLSDMSDKCARQRSPAYRRCRHNSKTRSCAHLHTPAHALAR